MSKLLEVNNLAVSFMTQAGSIDAVRDMSFAIEAGKTLAIVGESGSGKSVTAQAVMGILPRVAKIESGEILFHDRPEGDDGPVVTSDIAKLDPGGSEGAEKRRIGATRRSVHVRAIIPTNGNSQLFGGSPVKLSNFESAVAECEAGFHTL